MLSIRNMKKWKKIVITVLILLALFLSVILYNPIRTVMSIKKVDGFYTMTYYGNYDWLMERVNDYTYNHSSQFDTGGCSLFTALGNKNHLIYGRNYDWPDMPILITKCNPPDGYASISVTSPITFGLKKDLRNIQPPIKDKLLFLTAPYLSYDGMNEMGVTIALAKVDDQSIKLDKSKKMISFTFIERKILDHAKNINEAVNIIKKYNIAMPHSLDYGSNCEHWLIGDSSGKSVIVECFLNELKIIPNVESWQVATNTLVYSFYNSKDDVRDVPSHRYEVAYKSLKNAKGSISWEKGMDILKSVAQPITQYSMVYDMKNRDAYLTIYQNYNKVFKFNVKSKNLKYTIISNNH